MRGKRFPLASGIGTLYSGFPSKMHDALVFLRIHPDKPRIILPVMSL